jgi:AcrR family transcriptional regulator
MQLGGPVTTSPPPSPALPAGRPGSVPTGAAPGTKERLLDAAEVLFAERGFAATSVREVTRAAGVAVSAANYHYGSKEALLRAALMRRVEPANARRLVLLNEAVARGAVLEEVLAAFFRPALELWAEAANRGDENHTLRISALLYANPPAFVEKLKRDLFGEVLERFEAGRARARPRPSPESVATVAQLAIGSMVHLMRGEVPIPSGAEHDVDAQVQILVQFAAGGIGQATLVPDGSAVPAQPRVS